MTEKDKMAVVSSRMRRRAVAKLRDGNNRGRTAKDVPKSASDYQRVLHELQVHQIELEMQNAELLESRDRCEHLAEKYTELYDFAPVGLFSLDAKGLILEVNLTGATMLGVGRLRLINRIITRYIAPAHRAEFLKFLEQVLAGSGKQFSEASFTRADSTDFWASIYGIPTMPNGDQEACCRLTISDVTSLKHADDVKRRLDIMAASNLALHKEITHRLAVEEALKASERHYIQLLEQSQHMQRQLRKLSHQILSAQEDERKEISLELHDVISQTLIGINVRLAGLKRDALVNPRNLNRNLASVQRLVTRSVNIVHHFARELRPAMLDTLGLIPALRSFVEIFSKRTKLPVTVSIFPQIDRLGTNKCTVLYRVAQESLNNAARHARASHIDLSIRNLPDGIRMQIKDDGKSFDVERTLHRKGNQRLGLLGMKERLEMVGGSCSIDSAPGKGTVITAFIPTESDKRKLPNSHGFSVHLSHGPSI